MIANIRTLLIISLFSVFFSGCTMVAVQYQPDFGLVNDLKDIEVGNVALGSFSEKDESLNTISLRGSPMVSSFNGSYGQYLRNALKEQLLQAEIYGENSNVKIEGVLLENTVSAAGFSIGKANLAAIFSVKREGVEIYSGTHEIYHEWPSSFVGAVAIPNAQNNYPIAVQKLIKSFLLDPKLVLALTGK